MNQASSSKGTPSIRHSLEKEAWRLDPRFAMRMAIRNRKHPVRQRSLRWQDRSLLIIGITLLSLVLLRIETANANVQNWGLELSSGGVTSVQMAVNTDVKVEVTGLIARTEVTQVFSNPGDLWAEGIYRFPLPDGAAVDRMQIQVGDRLIEGEIRERETAKRVYQKALKKGFTAALVEQQKANQFETRLANIGPGEKIRVVIGFLTNVKFEEGSFSLRLPMTFTPRFDAPGGMALSLPVPHPSLVASETRLDQLLNVEVLIRTGIGFAAIESHYHDVEIEPTDNGYRVSLLDDFELSNRDFELSWYPDLQNVPQSSLMTWDGGDAIYAQLMMVPPLPGALDKQPREVVFIIDTSGSMEGESIRQARSALLQGLDELVESDTFNVIQFNSYTEVLFEESLPASRENKVLAAYYIKDLEADGGTAMAPALQAAFLLNPQPGLMRQVIFITDGSVGNEQSLLAGIGETLGDSRLFTIGIGSAPNSWFMRKAAEIGRGSHTHIGKLEEVEQRMTQLWDHIRVPALSDICVDWGMDAEYYPEIIPDLYAGEPLWVVARLPLQPREISICGRLNGQDWETDIRPVSADGTDTMATLWARKKIESLEESMVFGADRALTNELITQVALDHGLLTSQTSMVAVDKSPARKSGEALATGNVPSLLPAGSTRVVDFANTATNWQTQLLLSLLTLLISGWMYWSVGSRSPLGASNGKAR